MKYLIILLLPIVSMAMTLEELQQEKAKKNEKGIATKAMACGQETLATLRSITSLASPSLTAAQINSIYSEFNDVRKAFQHGNFKRACSKLKGVNVSSIGITAAEKSLLISVLHDCGQGISKNCIE